jgi:dolichyl-diphosphooligosaccharide--protein glycosyltransferase
MKKLVVIAAAAIVIAVAIGAVAAIQLQTPETPSGSATETQGSSLAATAASVVAIIETAQGPITVQFFPDQAPEHVRSFIDLAEGGFYDGVLFHRLVPGFVIQGGDPLTKDLSARDRWGTGGPGYTLQQEFNDISHSRGVLSMARSSDPNSAGSQFFIVLQDTDLIKSTLDRNYTVFGKVIEGMDVVDRIASLETVGGLSGNAEQPVNPDDAKIIKIRIERR